MQYALGLSLRGIGLSVNRLNDDRRPSGRCGRVFQANARETPDSASPKMSGDPETAAASVASPRRSLPAFTALPRSPYSPTLAITRRVRHTLAAGAAAVAGAAVMIVRLQAKLPALALFAPQTPAIIFSSSPRSSHTPRQLGPAYQAAIVALHLGHPKSCSSGTSAAVHGPPLAPGMGAEMQTKNPLTYAIFRNVSGLPAAPTGLSGIEREQ